MGKVLFPGNFPFCGEPVECNTPARTLSQIMYEYWVAKIWRVRILMTDNGAANPPQPQYNFYYGIDAESEEAIPCTGVFSFVYKYGDITETEFANNTFTNWVNDTNLCSLTSGSISRFSEANDDSLYFGNLQGLQQTGTANVSFGDGHTLAIPYAISSAQPGQDQDNYYEFITGIDISIFEYWSYGGTYNTQTGARL